ncbi:unnamed protein product [Phytophthora fragariaefolia]|uniref:Unnamed protein product n=1 Tax=Phytophthora fragariaefolia TaxID=1490495 RepID=A0A9W6Y176_9STRA|nr:unnamed protein product [Phytophthora fragariaefolia]
MMQVLDIFGKASGLQINTGKTLVIALHPRGLQPATQLPTTLKYQGQMDACRYLGIQVGSRNHSATTWQNAINKLAVRLHIASQKVLTVDQRSLIAGAVIIPALLYVAQHAWPTAKEVHDMDARIRNYIWHGQFSTDVTGVRAWLDPDLANLPRTCGGLAVPLLRAELYALTATAVTNWAERGTKQSHIVGDILLHGSTEGLAPHVFITPEYVPPAPTGVHRRSSLWLTGRMLVEQAGTSDTGINEALTKYVEKVHAAGGITCNWKGTTLGVDSTALLAAVATTKDLVDPRAANTLHTEWLPFAAIKTLQVITTEGKRVSLAQAAGYTAKPNCLLKDVFNWTRPTQGHLQFETAGATVPIPPRGVVEGLAKILVTNFISMTQRNTHHDEIRFTTTPLQHPVVITTREADAAAIEIVILTGVWEPPITRRAEGHDHLTRAITEFMAPEVEVTYVHPHPRLSRLVCIWAGRRRWTRTRREYKQRVAAASIRRGNANRKARATRWENESGDAARGLETLEWKRIRRIVGMGPWGEEFLLRLKLHAYSVFDVRNNRPGCPHATCEHLTEVDLHHIFWDCPAADKLRKLMLQPWRKLGLQESGLEQAIFGLRLHEIPRGVWNVVDAFRTASLDPPLQLMEAVTCNDRSLLEAWIGSVSQLCVEMEGQLL